jgi:hypothetical protein
LHERNRERKGNLKLECGWCAPSWGANKVVISWQRPLWEGDQEVVKRSDRNKPMWFAIHKFMEAILGISLYSYLYPKLTKMIHLSYLSLMISLQQNQIRGWNKFCLEAGGWGGLKSSGDGGRRWHKQYIYMKINVKIRK